MQGIDLKRAVRSKPAGDDWFTVGLIRLILKADSTNKDKLALGYPVEVAACNIFKTNCPYLNEAQGHVDYDRIVEMAIEEVEGEAPKAKTSAEKL
jgi:hypothetical protein